MTYYVTATTANGIIVHELRTSDPIAASFVADHWADCGHTVIERSEG